MKKDLTKGSIVNNLWNLSWPLMIAFLLHSGFNLVDAYFVGKISALALAAVSISFPILFLMMAAALGVGIGITSLISRLLGAKRKKEADNVAEHSILIGVVMALFFTVFGLVSIEQLFVFAGATKEMMPLAIDYMTIMLWGSIFMFMMFTGNSILRGEGDTKTPMFAMGISNILNIILDPILIFGSGIIPAMGIKGAALATIISRAIAAVIVITFMLRGKSFLTFDFSHFKFRLKIIKDVFVVGIPASLSQMATSIGSFLIIKIISYFGANAIAAFGLAMRLESVAFLPIIAIGTATITIVGHNIGAKKLARAEKTAWSATGIAVVLIELIGLIIFLIPYHLMAFFNTNPEVISIGGNYLKIVSLTYCLGAVGVIIGSSFQGAGKGIPAFLGALLRLIIIGVPLSYLTAVKMNLGIEWTWYSLIFAALVSSTTMVIWFKAGTWKKGHVDLKEIPEPVTSI